MDTPHEDGLTPSADFPTAPAAHYPDEVLDASWLPRFAFPADASPAEPGAAAITSPPDAALEIEVFLKRLYHAQE